MYDKVNGNVEKLSSLYFYITFSFLVKSTSLLLRGWMRLYGQITNFLLIFELYYLSGRHLSGRFKSKETDFVSFITKNHISRYAYPIFMCFMSKNSQYSSVLEYIFVIYKPLLFITFISFLKGKFSV